MHMVGHESEFVGFEIWEAIGQCVPGLFNEFAGVGGDHIAGVDCAEDGFALVSADRDEIHAGVGIVVVGEADGFAIWVHGATKYAGRGDTAQFVGIRRARRGGKCVGDRQMARGLARGSRRAEQAPPLREKAKAGPKSAAFTSGRIGKDVAPGAGDDFARGKWRNI